MISFKAKLVREYIFLNHSICFTNFLPNNLDLCLSLFLRISNICGQESNLIKRNKMLIIFDVKKYKLLLLDSESLNFLHVIKRVGNFSNSMRVIKHHAMGLILSILTFKSFCLHLPWYHLLNCWVSVLASICNKSSKHSFGFQNYLPIRNRFFYWIDFSEPKCGPNLRYFGKYLWKLSKRFLWWWRGRHKCRCSLCPFYDKSPGLNPKINSNIEQRLVPFLNIDASLFQSCQRI